MSVPGILRLARRNAEKTRRTYAALGAALVDGVTPEIALTDWQRSILSQLLRQVVGDIYGSLRWLVLAEIEDGADRGKALSHFAPDSETRVFALMSQRGLLADSGLIEAIAHRLYQHQLEQATRPPDRNRWSNQPALDDPGEFFGEPLPEFSPLSRRIAAHIIDRSRRTDRYGNPVLVPGEIEPRLYERLHWRVAAVLRHMLAEGIGVDLQRLDARIEAAAMETIRHSSATAAAPTSSAEAARALESAGLLNMESIHRLLQAGEISLFEEAFAKLAGLRPVLLRRLLYEAGGECFAVLTRALDVDLDRAQAIFALVRTGRSKQFREANGGEGPLNAIYGAVSLDDANRVREHWKRRSDFAFALWESETGRSGDAADTLH
jgi:hypothetical protein